jgi:hypothetical protein
VSVDGQDDSRILYELLALHIISHKSLGLFTERANLLFAVIVLFTGVCSRDLQ